MKYIMYCFATIIAIAMLMSACGPSESDLFEQQMKKDPSTWSRTEINRFNGFMDWLEEN